MFFFELRVDAFVFSVTIDSSKSIIDIWWGWTDKRCFIPYCQKVLTIKLVSFSVVSRAYWLKQVSRRITLLISLYLWRMFYVVEAMKAHYLRKWTSKRGLANFPALFSDSLVCRHIPCIGTNWWKRFSKERILIILSIKTLLEDADSKDFGTNLSKVVKLTFSHILCLSKTIIDLKVKLSTRYCNCINPLSFYKNWYFNILEVHSVQIYCYHRCRAVRMKY